MRLQPGLIIIIGCFMLVTKAQNIPGKVTLHWEKIAETPSESGIRPHLGLAGPVTGLAGNAILVAGGSNFPDNLPWKGGHKTYYKKAYILQKHGKEFKWTSSPLPDLKEPVAYPANVEVPQGLMSIGGENEHGALKQVFLYRWKGRKLHITRFPDLPEGITSAEAAAIGSKVFVAGGMAQNQPLNSFYCLDIADPGGQWVRLPDLPVALSNAVVVSQNDGTEDCIYVIGGRYKLSTQPVTTFSEKVYVYSLKNRSWREETPISDGEKTFPLAAGTGVAYGKDHIILLGGDLGIIYNQTEQFNNQLAVAESKEKLKLQAEKEELLNNHPGFYKGILAYNTITRKWSKIGEAQFPVQATTSAFTWKKRIIISQGEIRPGIRTPDVISLTIKNLKSK